MALNVSAWSIRRPLPSLLLFLALSIVGVVSFLALPITSMPEVRIPQVSVTISQSGAAPAELETQVTRRVENAVAGLLGVSKVTSEVSEGQSTTTIAFEESVAVDRALDDVRDAVSRISSDLPGSADEPVVQRVEELGGSIATYALQAPLLSPEAQSWLIDDRVTRVLKAVPGVASVSRQGGTDREIRVELDPLRLQALGVTVSEIGDLLNETLLDQSSGLSEVGAQEQSLRVYGAVSSVEELAALSLKLPRGQSVTLGELAQVTDAQAEVRSVAFMDGVPVIAFSVTAAPGYSAPAVGLKVAEVLATLDEELDGASIQMIDTEVLEMEATYAATMDTLIEGAILAIIVVFLFLRDLRATIIAALAIPLSILPTFWVMDLLGFSLNNVSLLAVTLVTGVLVDDAIVEIENIIRHIRMGKTPYQAAIEAADEIGLAVMATSATIVAVFLPVSFMTGMVGQIFKQFGVTIAVSVVFSLLVARLISPLLAAYFMTDTAHVESGPGPILRWYGRMVDLAVRWRFATVTAGVAIFAASIWMVFQLPSGFFPDEDGVRSELNVELPPGVTLSDAAETILQISDRVRAHPEVVSVYASIGTGGDMRMGSVSVALVPADQRDIDQRSLERLLQAELAAIPDLKLNFSAGMGGREFAMSLTGADGPATAHMAEMLEAAIRAKVPALENIQSKASVVRPELRIVPRQADAAALGVSPSEIASVLRIATQGDMSQNLAKFTDDARQIDIKVLLPETARQDLALLENLLLRSSTGAAVPLAAIADISAGAGPASIERRNGMRQIQIEADLAPGADLGSAVAAVMALEEVKTLPESMTFAEAGDAEELGNLFSSFLYTMGVGLMLVLIVLILLYSDIFQPITILLSLPLSIGGAVTALMITNNPISLPVIIGILMLIAVVTKNAILLVDFAIEEIHRGVPRREALIDAGMKRAQPIVMTTIAMIAGMLPAALAVGNGDGFRVPMAIAVIGGLLASTVLSLVFVPAVFTYLDDLEHIMGKIFGRFLTNRGQPVCAPPRLQSVPPRAEAAE